MSWKGRTLRQAAPVLDVVLAPAVWAAAQTLLLVRRMTPRHAPNSFRIMDRVGVYPLVDHYYEPMINPRHLRHPMSQPRDLPGLPIDLPAAMDLLRGTLRMEEMAGISGTAPVGDSPAYHWDNSFFGPLDAAVLHGMVRRLKPRRILEVGCGMSTLAAQQAIARNTAEGAAPCRHTCIEPYENAWLAALPIDLVRDTAETADPALVDALEAGDILFIDSSHMIRPQGDVLTEVLSWLGRLKPGVAVHIHDVFTPRDYPEAMIRDHRFFWNEQYLVEAFLAFNPRFRVTLPLHHMMLTDPAALLALCPAQADAARTPPTSFWFDCVT